MKKVTILVFVMIAVLLFSASMVDAFKVRFISRELPGPEVRAWNHYTFSAEIEYESNAQGMPLPMYNTFHIEVDRNLFARPLYQGGSFTSMNFVIKTGTMTGRWVWESHQGFIYLGTVRRHAEVTAQATWPPGTGQNFIGNIARDVSAHYFRNVTLVP
jgi:hypothetical protein